MNKKYYVAPAVAVEHVEMESLCAAVSGGLKEDPGSGLSGSLNNPEQDGDAGEAAGKINIHDVWE